MGELISQYGGTALVCLCIIGLVAAAIWSMRRDKKAGKSACGCNCSGCAGCSACNQNK